MVDCLGGSGGAHASIDLTLASPLVGNLLPSSPSLYSSLFVCPTATQLFKKLVEEVVPTYEQQLAEKHADDLRERDRSFVARCCRRLRRLLTLMSHTPKANAESHKSRLSERVLRTLGYYPTQSLDRALKDSYELALFPEWKSRDTELRRAIQRFHERRSDMNRELLKRATDDAREVLEAWKAEQAVIRRLYYEYDRDRYVKVQVDIDGHVTKSLVDRANRLLQHTILSEAPKASDLGQLWTRLDAEPSVGREVRNAKLGKALRRGQHTFNRAEIDSFGVDVLGGEGYIRAGRAWYQPVQSKLGLQWRKLRKEPRHGTEIHNAKLVEALLLDRLDRKGKRGFTPAELKSFKLQSLSRDSYIQVGNAWFMPMCARASRWGCFKRNCWILYLLLDLLCMVLCGCLVPFMWWLRCLRATCQLFRRSMCGAGKRILVQGTKQSNTAKWQLNLDVTFARWVRQSSQPGTRR